MSTETIWVEIYSDTAKKVLGRLASAWTVDTADSIASNCALQFNYLRAKMAEYFGMEIPCKVIIRGRCITLTEELVMEIWEKQHANPE